MQKPAAPLTLKWLKQHLEPERSREGAANWAAVATGYVRLPLVGQRVRGRRPERLRREQEGFAARVTPKKQGEPCGSMAGADEAAVKIRGSKTY